MGYYRGDYYQGDFWSGLGRGIKRIGRDIGRVARAAAPVAGILVPTIGAATLVGKGIRTAQRIKQTGRALRDTRRAYELKLTMNKGGLTPAAPVNKMAPAMPVLVPAAGAAPNPLAGQDASAPPRVSAASQRVRRIRRAAYRRRRATTARRRTTRRYTRRVTRRRSRRS